MAIELGKLEQVDPRQVWLHEAHDFTPWLLQNQDRLSEALGIDLELEAAEHPVGGYSLDLVGRDVTNDAVLIVENQLEQTNHSHLGQILTYAAGTLASTVVWVATSFREEHRQALDWLNEVTDESTHFFGIELQVVRIGGSPPAPLFSLVAQPNDWQKRVRTSTHTASLSGKRALYVKFWGRFLDRVHSERPEWTRARTPSADNWFDLKSAIKGAHFSMSFGLGDRLRHELYIDSGDADENLELFEHLKERQTDVEAAYHGSLSWEELSNRRACRVADYKEACSVTDEDRYDEYITWLIDAGTRLRESLSSVAAPAA